jgi:prepilin-type N-terminal cleavage/methylation domain-containing protein
MATSTRLSGFTLIELLISISILSLVIGIATFSFSLFATHWNGVSGRFERAAGQHQRVELLNQAIRDAAAWLVLSDAGKDAQKRQYGFYFLGREEGMTFVTESPIFQQRELAVVRVFREREQGTQTWRLVYEEAPLRGLLLRQASQILPFSNRLVILRELPSLEFRYFGWRSRTDRLVNEGVSQVNPEWFDEYDGILRQQQPKRIALRFGGSEITFEVAARDDVMFGLLSEAPLS